jgi:hypothetical protein
MNSRRFICLFLGAWLATGVAVALLIFLNHTTDDVVIANIPSAIAAQTKSVGPAQARLLLTHHSLELNRLYMEYWGSVQIVAGVFFLLVLLFGTREGKVALIVGAVMLTVIILQRMLLVPETTALTRMMQAGPAREIRYQLLSLRMVYHGIEVVKLLVGGVALILLVREGRYRSRYAGKDVDVVDKPDHSHIYR